MSAATKQSKAYDEGKLAEMAEPLTVYVEQVKGSQKTPIPIPCFTDEGEAEPSTPGSGWMKENVRSLVMWLVNEWSGGGLYHIEVTDSSTPVKRMVWEPFFPPTQYPPRTPPPLAAGSIQSAPPLINTNIPTPQARPMSYPLPPGYQQPLYYPQPAAALPVGNTPTNQYAMQMALDAERRRFEDEIAKLRAEREQARMAEISSRHAAELKAEREAANERFSRIETSITALITTMNQAATTGGTKNGELEEMKRRLDDERREREAERREQLLKEMITANNLALQQQIQTLTSQLTTAQNQRGPDPMLTMMIDNMKELSRSQADQFGRLANFMMNPRDVLQIAKEASASTDQNSDRLARMYSDAFDMHRKAVESALQLQPGDGGAVGLIREGLDRVSNLAERYVTGKSREVTATAQAQAEIARAQAHVATAQAHAARAPIVTPPPPEQAQIPAQTGSGLSGMSNGAQNGARKQQPAQVIPINQGPKRKGRTDEEWFGPSLSLVRELREGVAAFLESLAMTPPRLDPHGNPVGIDPETCAKHVLVAQGQAMQARVPIPALIELLNQGMYADFVDVLLPDTSDPFRIDVVSALRAEIEGEEDDDDDVDDSDSNAHDGKPMPPRPAPRSNQPQPKA